MRAASALEPGASAVVGAGLGQSLAMWPASWQVWHFLTRGLRFRRAPPSGSLQSSVTLRCQNLSACACNKKGEDLLVGAVAVGAGHRGRPGWLVASRNRSSGAGFGNVAHLTTGVTCLRSAALGLAGSRSRAVGPNVAPAAAAVTLLRLHGARRFARGRLVARLETVEAYSLRKLALLGQVTHCVASVSVALCATSHTV